MRKNTSELILDFMNGKDFILKKEIMEKVSSLNDLSEGSVRVALDRLHKAGNIERSNVGREYTYKYVCDLAPKERKLDPKKFVRDYIFSIIKGKELTLDEVAEKVNKKFDTTRENIKTILSRESGKGKITRIEDIPLRYTIE